jgi:predicted GIY-YIG superfamily endonuclease
LNRLQILLCFAMICFRPMDLWAQTDESLREAFEKTHGGWSVDELLIRDDRRKQFLDAVAKDNARERNHDFEKSMLLRLIQIRKAGKLEIATTKRDETDLEGILPISEIASRKMMDQYQANIDQWLVDPRLLQEFDALVESIAPGTNPYEARKGALQLRKTRKLQPELISRVVDWKREIVEMTVDKAIETMTQLPMNAGVYIFRDTTGYLYIGQSKELRTRLTKHLQDSDRKSLSAYLKEHGERDMVLELHIFAPDSPAANKVVREAYESDLIRTRKPRLNVAP